MYQLAYICTENRILRVVAYILSCIIFVLTLMPCIDKPVDNILTKTESTQHSNDSHQDEMDHCSPFCTCQCCQKTVQIVTSLNSSIPFIFTESYFKPAQKLLNDYLFDFYTPPKG